MARQPGSLGRHFSCTPTGIALTTALPCSAAAVAASVCRLQGCSVRDLCDLLAPREDTVQVAVSLGVPAQQAEAFVRELRMLREPLHAGARTWRRAGFYTPRQDMWPPAGRLEELYPGYSSWPGEDRADLELWHMLLTIGRVLLLPWAMVRSMWSCMPAATPVGLKVTWFACGVLLVGLSYQYGRGLLYGVCRAAMDG